MQQGINHSRPTTTDESKLVLPGMRSKARIAPPSLDRLDSGLTSPCVSDATLTNRRLRDSLPCTPSPMYAYDASFGFGSLEGPCRVFPRFFPFVYAEHHLTQPKVSRYNSNETIVDEDMSFVQPRVMRAPQSRESSPNSTPLSNRMLISPKELRRVSNTVSTPLATVSDSSSETCESVQVLSLLKTCATSNGTFDLCDPVIDLNQVIEHVVDISKDQTGSRYIQQLLDSKKLSVNEIHQLFVRILPHTRQLTVDQFGNYVIQKLLDDLPESSMGLLFNQLTGSFFTYSIHMYGCRVVQRVIETASSDRLFVITEELKGHVIECVEDQNANHVIQKLIERLPVGKDSQSLRKLVEEFLGHVPRMAMHCYGCRVVQRLIEKLKSMNDCLQILIAEILANLWQLSQDQYGNYVVQHVLLHGSPSHRSVIVQVIASHIIEFSCHKYASNIAEKAMLCSTDQISRDVIIAAVIGSGGPDSPLFILMKDRFANYVIQRCLEFSHGHQRQMLINILKANLTTLKGVIYGKHIATAIERIMSTPTSSSQ